MSVVKSLVLITLFLATVWGGFKMAIESGAYGPPESIVDVFALAYT